MSRPSKLLAEQAPGVKCAALSDVGMRRSNNQDSLAISLASETNAWRDRGHLFVVADGMGAHAAGELASQIATENIPLTFHKLRDLPPMAAVVAAVEDANRRIYERGKDSVDFHGMGTTCSCLLLTPEGAMAAHVGDSRVYRLRSAQFEQLTFDHSLVWEMGAAAQATEEQVPAYVPRNVITRSLGPHATVRVDAEGPLPIVEGDRFLLCSDGLTGPLSPELIGMVAAMLPPSEAAQTLVDLANLLGGPDNISVIVVEMSSPKQNGAGAVEALPPSSDVASPEPRDASWLVALRSATLLGALASAGLAFSHHVWGAAVCGLLALGCAAGWRFMKGKPPYASPAAPPIEPIQRGKAPYRRYDIRPTSEKIELLGEIVRQIEDLEAQKEWHFDWRAIHADRHAALQAIGEGDFSSAVVSYASAVRRLMQALREDQAVGASDSTINLGAD